MGQVEGGERRASVSERDQFPPAGLARPRPPSLACGAAGEQLAGEERQRRRPAEAFGQRGVGAKKRERLGVGAQRDHRLGGRGGGDRGRPAAPARLPERGGELRRLFRIERRLQVGRDGGEALGAKRVAADRERPERGIDPSRRPELLSGFRERDRVAQRRLVLAPVEQVLRHRGGAFRARRRRQTPAHGGSDLATESSAESAAPAKNSASASEWSRNDPPGRAQAGARGGSNPSMLHPFVDLVRTRLDVTDLDLARKIGATLGCLRELWDRKGRAARPRLFG